MKAAIPHIIERAHLAENDVADKLAMLWEELE